MCKQDPQDDDDDEDREDDDYDYDSRCRSGGAPSGGRSPSRTRDSRVCRLVQGIEFAGWGCREYRVLVESVEVQIIPAGWEQLEAVVFFCDCVLRRDYFLPRGQVELILSGKRHRSWVAVEGVALVGFAVASKGSGLLNVLVHPAFRGLGIGRALVEASGVEKVRCKLDMVAGDPSLFYRRLGFTRRVGKNARGNVVVLQKGRGV